MINEALASTFVYMLLCLWEVIGWQVSVKSEEAARHGLRFPFVRPHW